MSAFSCCSSNSGTAESRASEGDGQITQQPGVTSTQPTASSSNVTEQASSELLFNSLARSDLSCTVKKWYCANDECKRGKDNGGFIKDRVNEGEVQAHVLRCGHYLCQDCLQPEGESSIKEFKCRVKIMGDKRCDTSTDVSDGFTLMIPFARHVNKYVEKLANAGLDCVWCKDVGSGESSPQYPHELMFISVTGASMTHSLSQSGIGDGPAKATSRCSFCYLKKVDKDSDEPKLISINSSQAKTWKSNLEEAGKGHVKTRSPSHLRMFGSSDLAKFMKEVLRCHGCREEYSDYHRNKTPTIIDCGHLCCSECAEKMKSDGGHPSGMRCPTCDEPTKYTRDAHDIAWAMTRSAPLCVKCSNCKKLHVQEFIADNEPSPICLFCRTLPTTSIES